MHLLLAGNRTKPCVEGDWHHMKMASTNLRVLEVYGTPGVSYLLHVIAPRLMAFVRHGFFTPIYSQGDPVLNGRSGLCSDHASGVPVNPYIVCESHASVHFLQRGYKGL